MFQMVFNSNLKNQEFRFESFLNFVVPEDFHSLSNTLKYASTIQCTQIEEKKTLKK